MNKGKILFLDESGDHNLTAIDPQHPVFVLAGIITTHTYAAGELTDRLNAFKKDLFTTTDIHLHTADFTRQKNGFERMKEPDFCASFYDKLNALIDSLDITIIACAIKKQQHMDKYGFNAIDPYHLSVNVLVERFYFDVNRHKVKGHVIAEARDATLDRQLELAWMNTKISGTYFLQAVDINRTIEALTLRTKQDKIAGLEIADAVVTPIARHILGRKSRINLDIIKKKMPKNNRGEVTGHGLIILPKK